MSFDSDSFYPRRLTEYHLDGENRLLEVREISKADGTIANEFIWNPEPAPPPFTFEHDEEERLFVLTWSDGRTERFRDEPVRHLVVAPDPETGEMRPVIQCGRPMYLYLCTEEPEL
jgi:hypothetical protein